MGINEESVNTQTYLNAAFPPGIKQLAASLIRSAPVHCFSVAILLWGQIPVLGNAHERSRPKAFEGRLHLTRAPRIGGSATLVLSSRSNLAESVNARILFHLPRGIVAESPDQFDNVYFPPDANERRHSIRLRVKDPGNYPLQASIYAIAPGGKNIAQHFYTYLLVTASDSEIGEAPFTEEAANLSLQTDVQSSSAGDKDDGALIIRGSVSYFDDNILGELPVRRPQLRLVAEDQFAGDTIVGYTVGDERGNYNFDNLSHPALHDGRPRNLYIVLTFDNSVLSITDKSNRTYALHSETYHDVPDGENVVDLVVDRFHPIRGVCHIFNAIQNAHAFLFNRLAWERDRPIQVVWPGPYGISYYDMEYTDDGGSRMTQEHIAIAPGEHQWMRIIMFHEYAHAGDDRPRTATIPTPCRWITTPARTVWRPCRILSFAFYEGWAAFMEAAVDNNALNVTGFLDKYSPNIESNQWWTGHVNGAGHNVRGELVEGAVASILWDIFDTPDSIDLAPGVDDDSVTDKLDSFWEIFVTEAPQNITDIAMAWRRRNLPMLKELEAIYANHHTLSRPNSPPTFRFSSPKNGGGVAEENL